MEPRIIRAARREVRAATPPLPWRRALSWWAVPAFVATVYTIDTVLVVWAYQVRAGIVGAAVGGLVMGGIVAFTVYAWITYTRTGSWLHRLLTPRE